MLLEAAIGNDGIVEVEQEVAGIALDESVLRILLEEALSNAIHEANTDDLSLAEKKSVIKH